MKGSEIVMKLTKPLDGAMGYARERELQQQIEPHPEVECPLPRNAGCGVGARERDLPESGAVRPSPAAESAERQASSRPFS